MPCICCYLFPRLLSSIKNNYLISSAVLIRVCYNCEARAVKFGAENGEIVSSDSDSESSEHNGA